MPTCGRVLEANGLSSISSRVIDAMVNGQVTEAAVAPGARFEWMAFRRGGRRADILGARCAGTAPKPFAAFEFDVGPRNENLHLHDPGGLRQPVAGAA